MKKTAVLLEILLWAVVLSGCRFIRIEEEPRRSLEYSIVKQEELPGELTALIREKEAEGVSADLSKRERAVSGKRIWNTAKRRLQHSGGGAWGNLPGHIFPHKADRSVRRKNRHKPTILPIHCGKDGLAEGTCDL